MSGSARLAAIKRRRPRSVSAERASALSRLSLGVCYRSRRFKYPDGLIGKSKAVVMCEIGGEFLLMVQHSFADGSRRSDVLSVCINGSVLEVFTDVTDSTTVSRDLESSVWSQYGVTLIDWYLVHERWRNAIEDQCPVMLVSTGRDPSRRGWPVARSRLVKESKSNGFYENEHYKVELEGCCSGPLHWYEMTAGYEKSPEAGQFVISNTGILGGLHNAARRISFSLNHGGDCESLD